MSKMCDDLEGANEEKYTAKKRVSRFRVVLPQVLASTAKNMVLLDFGMTVAFSTIIIPALHNAEGPLSLNDDETSWLGSIIYIFQPLGSILFGPLLEPLGRKYSLILVNLPHLVGWLMLYWADNKVVLFVAMVAMGLSTGMMEAPAITYVGEICQPEVRGILTSYAVLFVQLGFVLQCLLGSVMNWRMVALSSATVPIFTALVITLIPESPMWLLSRGRTQEAENALCWLRGWVSPPAVERELQQMLGYHQTPRSVRQIRNASRKGETLTHEEVALCRASVSRNWAVTVLQAEKETPDVVLKDAGCCITETACSKKISDLMSMETLRPLFLVLGLFFFHHSCGMAAVRPYMVVILRDFNMPIEAHWGTVIISMIGLCGNGLCMVLVSWCGKRPLALVSLAGCALSCLLIGSYAYALLSVEEDARAIGTWAPLTVLVTLIFSFNAGIGPAPWMVLSEVFPFRARSLGSGIGAGAYYILGFVVSKTYLWLKNAMGLSGVFWMYGCIGATGVGLLCWKMPETEGKTLAEIEDIYGWKRSRGNLIAEMETFDNYKQTDRDHKVNGNKNT